MKPTSTVIIGPQPHEQIPALLEDYAREVGVQAFVRDGVEAEVSSRAAAVGGQMVTLRTRRECMSTFQFRCLVSIRLIMRWRHCVRRK